MRVMVIIKATAGSEAGEMPSQELLVQMGEYNEQLVKAGLMKAGDGLKPSSKGARVRFSGSERTVVNGPFAETKGLIAGYWIWEVQSLEEAIDWVRRCPNPMTEDSEIEIRPLFEMEDFAEQDPDQQVAEHEQDLRHKVQLQSGVLKPYLFLGGRCEEAIHFYQDKLAATVPMMMRFSESPDPLPEGSIPPGFESKIMHTELQIGANRLMASDGCGEPGSMEGFRLALSVPDEATCEYVFAALSDGGKVDMELHKTFWTSKFGMVTDQFGVGWMVMVQEDEPPAA